MREGIGRIYTMSAPVAGWNRKLPLPSVPEIFALSLVNWIPTATGVKKRGGSERMTDTAFTSACETVLGINLEDGTSQVIVAGDNDLMTVNLTTHARSSVKGGSTITSNRWQFTQFYDRIFVANGADRVLSYNGTGNFAAAGFTISASPDDNLYSPFAYRERLYFCKGTSIFYTQNVREITGALDEFDFATILTKGGKLLFGMSSTFNIGDHSQELFVVVSSEGEVIAYEGSDPSDISWDIVGHFYLPRSPNYSAFFAAGAGLQIITEQGVISLSEVINPSADTKKTGRYLAATSNIDDAFASAMKNAFSNYGWCGVNHTHGNLLIINVPVSSNRSIQFVQNTLTEGAWCSFEGFNAASWFVSGDYAYFGGFDGHLYRYDSAQNDNVFEASEGDGINCRGETAFTYAGDQNTLKMFLQALPIVYTTGDATLNIGVNVTFGRNASVSPVQISGTTGGFWDDAEWDVDDWADNESIFLEWKSIEGSGINCSIVFSGTLTSVDMQILGFLLQVADGGVIS